MKAAVFASGGGSNFENLIELSNIGYLKTKIELLLTDRVCPALKKAERFSIPSITSKDDKLILAELRKRKIELIILAGYLSKISTSIIERYYGRIINIHPALLPSFGGKGYYGINIHRSVIEKGVKISGITIHFVDKDYDTGPIIFQRSIPITSNDTPSSIEEKIHQLEYFYYPFVLNMICDGIIELKDRKVILNPNKKISSKHALISLQDKEGSVDFARELNRRGYLIISTGGTYKLLRENGIKVIPISAITGFDEILDGRVKTLNNIIFGGILARREKISDINQINEFFIPQIDIVAVNLYNFQKAAERYEAFDDNLMEEIDIGGVSLIRAAAKNFKDVMIVCDKEDYSIVLKNLDNPDESINRYLARKAFEYIARYDCQIASKLSNDEFITIGVKKISDLRYGENPHQKATLYSQENSLPFIQLWGKELSYNNLLDAYSSWQAVCDFKDPACVIFKHVTPSGIARDDEISKAVEKAYTSDPLSAFGGIIAINRKLTERIAQFLSDKFIEIISAPDFDEKAIEILKKKKNLRILKWQKDIRDCKIIRSIGNEILLTDPDNITLSERWDVVSGKITKKEKEALIFAFTCVKHVRSNAIVLSSESFTVGIGAGQMSRIDALEMAHYKYLKYLENNPKPEILVMASDGFFPFEDSIVKAKEIGVQAIIQPGGSIRDKNVIEKAKELGIKMVLTGLRHFKH